MKETIKNKLNLFIENEQEIRKKFSLHFVITKRMAALLYALENKKIDIDSIKKCHDMIKRNTNVFSAFRGDMILSTATLLSLSPNPHEMFEKTLKVYQMLKDVKFRSSEFLVIAAYQIAVQTEENQYINIVNRTRAFYEGMKKYHFFYTGQDDYIFAAMLGLSDLEVEAATEHIEQIYRRLKNKFWDNNSVQTLTQVFGLNKADEYAEKRIFVLRDALKERKLKMDKSYTLPVLGILALLPIETEVIFHDIDEIQKILRAQKKFGSLSTTMQEVLLFSAAVATSEYTHEIADNTLTATLSTNITNIIIAQQAAMIAAITASSAAAAASS